MDRMHSKANIVPATGAQPDGQPTAARAPWPISDLARARAAADEPEAAERPRTASPARSTATTSSDDDSQAPATQPANERLFDIDLLADYARFVARSVGRNVVGSAATLALTLAAVGMLVSVWPKTYQIDGVLLVQHNSLVSSLVNPGRAMSRSNDAPTTGVQQVVHGRENLLGIIKDTDLLVEWQRTRAPLLLLKDRVFSLIGSDVSEEQRLNRMVGLLEDRLQVSAAEDGAVTFFIRWPNAEMGKQIVDRAMQRYLEFKRTTESAAIADSIAILDRSAASLEARVNETLSQMPRRRTGAPVAAAPIRRVVVPAGPPAETTVRLARLRTALDTKQQEVIQLDAARNQQLQEAQARLNGALSLYTDGHPTVVALRQAVTRLSAESPELAAARREARNLANEFDALSTKVGAATADAERQRIMQQVDVAAPFANIDLSRGDETDPVGLRLKNQLGELADVHARASAARAELASADAGFKYQYSVVRPPQIPNAPLGPNVPAILGSGLVASLLLAMAFAVSKDLASGRILEEWQVKRHIGAPIELRVPTL